MTSASSLRKSLRWGPLVFCVAALFSLSSPSPGRAQATVGIDSLRGPGGERLREALTEAFEERGHRLLDEALVRAEVEAPNRWGATLARALDADLVLTGRVRRVGRRWVFAMRVHRSVRTTPQPLSSRGRSPEDLAERLVALFERRIPELRRARRDAESGADEAEPPEERAPAEEGDQGPSAGSRRPAADAEAPEGETGGSAEGGLTRRLSVEVEIGAGVQSRRLAYRDDLFDRVRPYRLSAAPVLALSLRAHPFSALDVAGIRDLSLRGGVEHTFVGESSRGDGMTFPTEAQAWFLESGYRIPFGAHRLWAHAGYHVRSFFVDPAGPSGPDNDPLPEVPKVRYRALRLGASARLAPLEQFFVEVAIAYDAILDAGGVQSEVWFPRATVHGLHAALSLHYRLSSGVALSARFAVDRMAFDIQPELGDRLIVGGAADRFLTTTLGIRFFH